jgi:hypothetical protein
MKAARLHLRRGWAVALAVALSAQVPFARAEVVDTDALAAPSQAEQDRAKVLSFMERANVKERLQAMGLNGLVAADRVAALSDAEVHALAQRIDTLPAGGALSQNDWILVLLLVILVAVLV